MLGSWSERMAIVALVSGKLRPLGRTMPPSPPLLEPDPDPLPEPEPPDDEPLDEPDEPEEPEEPDDDELPSDVPPSSPAPDPFLLDDPHATGTETTAASATASQAGRCIPSSYGTL